MLARTVLIISSALLLCLGGGCANLAEKEKGGDKYRTVAAQPGRDTDAAKKHNRRGVKLLKQGKLDAAKGAFNQALTADVEFGPAHNNLGKVYFKRERWYKAAWEFEYARKLMPKRPGPYNNLGLVLEQGGELERAIKQFRKAHQHAPENIEYLGNLTRALIKRGDRTKEVRRFLERILDEDTRPAWLTWAKRRLATLNAEEN
jgi:Flp pilus assembly protein TadD